MKVLKRINFKKFGIDMLFIIAGCTIGAFSTIGILIPNGLTSGGLTGMVRIVQGFLDINFSILYYGGALIILIVCAIFLGLKEARKILLLTILYPAFMFIFENINFNLLEKEDMLLAAIYCGIFTGICSGLIFTRGYSFSGTDTIATIIQKKLLPHIGISKILLVIDTLIIVGSGILFGRNVALYALVTQVIFSKTVDAVMYGFATKAVQVEIISKNRDEIAQYILNDLGRGPFRHAPDLL
jgi:uncharacterized membrane-anchored protein YitT (DUF2179 family)